MAITMAQLNYGIDMLDKAAEAKAQRENNETELFHRIRNIVWKYIDKNNLDANDLYVKAYVVWLLEENVKWCLSIDLAELEDLVLEDWGWFVRETIPPYAEEEYKSVPDTVTKYRLAKGHVVGPKLTPSSDI